LQIENNLFFAENRSGHRDKKIPSDFAASISHIAFPFIAAKTIPIVKLKFKDNPPEITA
jgi:hypothetical protein